MEIRLIREELQMINKVFLVIDQMNDDSSQMSAQFSTEILCRYQRVYWRTSEYDCTSETVPVDTKVAVLLEECGGLETDFGRSTTNGFLGLSAKSDSYGVDVFVTE